jgi:hypothetical protein
MKLVRSWKNCFGIIVFATIASFAASCATETAPAKQEINSTVGSTAEDQIQLDDLADDVQSHGDGIGLATERADVMDLEELLERSITTEVVDTDPAATTDRNVDAWKVTKCASAITVVILSVTIPALKLRRFVAAVGGVRSG